MGKRTNCNLTPRGRKSKDQGGKEIKGRATIYTPGKQQCSAFKNAKIIKKKKDSEHLRFVFFCNNFTGLSE